MSTQPLFQALQNSDFAIALGQSNHLYGALAQLFHISGLILILAPILLVNLRLLNVGLVHQPIPLLVRATNPLIWVGLVFMSLSGFFMFAPSAALYYPNPAVWWKFECLALALIVQFTLYRKITTANNPNPWFTKLTAVVSLSLWFGVAISGRIIGYIAA